MKKNNIILFAVVIAIILIISIIIYLKNGNIDEETAKCIASKSSIYVSKTCGHCANQKIILGDYYSLFTIIDCIDEEQKCIEAEISEFPTWFINSQEYKGVKSWKQLKQITNC